MSLRLRPHHVLCLRFFEGKGYSEAFVLHMYEIERALCGDPLVTLTNGCDDICTVCPHNGNDRCDHHEKVAAIDRRALDRIGLQTGDTLNWSALAALAREKVIDAGGLHDVCRDCEWRDICEKS